MIIGPDNQSHVCNKYSASSMASSVQEIAINRSGLGCSVMMNEQYMCT